jgi:CheY-like chemotaxis protein
LAAKPRILVVRHQPSATPLDRCQPDADLVYADSVPRALALIQREKFDGIYADTADLKLIHQVGSLLQADRILEGLAEAVVIVDPDHHIVWANAEFERWGGGVVEGKDFAEALDAKVEAHSAGNPFDAAITHGPLATCLQTHAGRYVHLHITPARDAAGTVTHFITLARDITAERQQQQKLDAIHRAGRELAALDPKHLGEMSIEERIELLKSNILRYSRELLHYDVIEIRLLDPTTAKLEALIVEGMTEVAAARTLYARAEGNGVTGCVAVTGKSYLCPDTTDDPHYIEGAKGAKSSLTVPLIYQDKVIGTFNVESPKPNAFTSEDQQFLEIFSREIADAIHTLELLVAEKRGTANQSVELIGREVAMPVDEILTAATGLLDRYIGIDPEMADRLQHILKNARSIKQCIQRVGEAICPPDEAEEQASPRHHSLRGLKVLVADNEDRVRRSAHQILGRFGCVVETAHDGREAVTMARLGNYDVILADIRLPDLNGYDLFKKIRQINPHLPIILMSGFGYDPGHCLVKARQEGLRGVLYKPFRVDQLLDVLEKLRNPTSVQV